MKFRPTPLEGAFIIELEAHSDHRGAFARTFCAREFESAGFKTDFVQTNVSRSNRKGTLRGMHFQRGQAAEVKLVRVTAGRILDVIIDVRRSSPTFGKHLKIELARDDNRLLYVPEGFAHGFVTLEDDCHVTYQVSNFYSPGDEGGIRWNDPFFGIDWPIIDPIMSDKDAAYPDFVA
ncbi:MAG: rfbC [Betaproteobacteria bacterium]|nr:rfbC [Betaproteobacteria bacterium]